MATWAPCGLPNGNLGPLWAAQWQPGPLVGRSERLCKGSPDGVASAVCGLVCFQSPAPGYLPKHLSIPGLVDYALPFAPEVDR
jgi:hypothetical protein